MASQVTLIFSFIYGNTYLFYKLGFPSQLSAVYHFPRVRELNSLIGTEQLALTSPLLNNKPKVSFFCLNLPKSTQGSLSRGLHVNPIVAQIALISIFSQMPP